MIESIMERAHQLIQLQRYKEAEKELREVLSIEPNRADALALFAICQAEQNNLEEADRLIKQAISKEPDNDYFLYLQALFYLRQNNLKEAEKFIRNAISFQPHGADYFGLLASIKLSQKEWQQALDAANQGLEVDPDNLVCLNSRSTALFKLDKKDLAYSSIQEALNKDPENEYTHANIGWGLLERGDHKQALEHFREALKINPNFDYAKAGLVEGLKARYWLYRVFLKYAFWLSNLKGKAQWAVILGLYFGVKFLGYLSERNPGLAVFLNPIIYVYVAFAISTWIIAPLSNLFLRLNIYGRYALKKEEIQASNFVGISLLIGLTGGVMYLFSRSDFNLSILIYGVTMMIPLASMFNAEKKKARTILVSYTIALALIGAGGLIQIASTGEVGVLGVIYMVGIVAYQWVANALFIR
jgi:tetratricopeptide (TPR) repeat protein